MWVCWFAYLDESEDDQTQKQKDDANRIGDDSGGTVALRDVDIYFLCCPCPQGLCMADDDSPGLPVDLDHGETLQERAKRVTDQSRNGRWFNGHNE